MAEYIEEYIGREKLLAKIDEAFFRTDPDGEVQIGFLKCRAIIRETPAADVAPVVYGRWTSPHWKNSNYCCNCSECGGEAMHREYQWNSKGIYPICPNCGARMDGESNGKAD